jgi:hypothetical protein
MVHTHTFSFEKLCANSKDFNAERLRTYLIKIVLKGQFKNNVFLADCILAKSYSYVV